MEREARLAELARACEKIAEVVGEHVKLEPHRVSGERPARQLRLA
jgi:hypothetical protein